MSAICPENVSHSGRKLPFTGSVMLNIIMEPDLASFSVLYRSYRRACTDRRKTGNLTAHQPARLASFPSPARLSLAVQNSRLHMALFPGPTDLTSCHLQYGKVGRAWYVMRRE